jgi:MFS family permease
VVAPTLAGILVDLVSWRVIFYLSGAIMLVSFLFALRVFDDVLDTEKKTFDVGSFLLSALAFGGITLGVGSITNHGFLTAGTLIPLVVGVVTGVIFAKRQLGQTRPFLELRILKERNYALSVIFSMVLYFVMMGSSILMPLYVQSVMGQSATVSGLVTLPGSLTMAIVSPFAGKLFDKAGIRTLLLAGSAAMMLSNFGMFFIGMDTPLWVASGLNVVRCVAIGCLLMPLVTWGLSGIPVELTAHGTALLNALRTVAGAVGTAVFVGIMSLVASVSAGQYGDGASLHGLNAAFLVMGIIAAGMLVGAVLLARTKREDDPTPVKVKGQER